MASAETFVCPRCSAAWQCRTRRCAAWLRSSGRTTRTSCAGVRYGPGGRGTSMRWRRAWAAECIGSGVPSTSTDRHSTSSCRSGGIRSPPSVLPASAGCHEGHAARADHDRQAGKLRCGADAPADDALSGARAGSLREAVHQSGGACSGQAATASRLRRTAQPCRNAQRRGARPRDCAPRDLGRWHAASFVASALGFGEVNVTEPRR
jgi:hypothetical protein